MVHSKYFLVFLVFNFTFPCYGLKILMVTDFFPHPTRPFIDKQIEGLVEDGHHIDILAKKPYRKKQTNSLKYPLQVYYIDNVPSLDSYNIIYCQLGHLSPKFAELKQEKGYTWKLVVAFRGYDATAVLKEDPHYYDLVFKVGDLFLPVCHFFKKNLIKAGCDEKKIIVHHSAIDCDLFSFVERRQPKNNIFEIVSVGRLDPLKGYEYAIEAISILIKKGINIIYTIVGSGKLEKKLRILINKLGYNEQIFLVGNKSHEEIHKILQRAHIFLLASTTTSNYITEGIPNALMEAMATGLPVISTYHAGIPELVRDGASGFLIPEKNSNILAEKLEFLLYHSELWTLLGKTGRDYINREHNIKLMNAKLKILFQNL